MIVSAEHISCMIFQFDIETEPSYYKYLIMITSFPLVSWDNLSLCRITIFKYSQSSIKTVFYFCETSASSHSQLLAGSLFIYYFLISQRMAMAVASTFSYIFLVINPNLLAQIDFISQYISDICWNDIFPNSGSQEINSSCSFCWHSLLLFYNWLESNIFCLVVRE